MDDDFNTARAIGHLFEISHLINSYLAKASRDNAQDQAVLTKAVAVLKELGQVLGIFIDQESDQGAELEEVLQILAGLRQAARQEKDYPLADDIRNFLGSLDISIEDTPAATRFRYESAPELKLLMEKLIDLRANFKSQKRYEKADYIRNSLQEAGIIVEDTREGVRWKIAEA
jgi:cysteinyl-tRNA synthetase